nr:U-box domain-containing protein 40-like [Ipomoea batatas]
MGDSLGRQPRETATADSQGRQPGETTTGVSHGRRPRETTRETTKGGSHGSQPWKTATGDNHDSQLQESVKEASHFSLPAVTPLASSIPGVQSPNPKALFQRSNLFYPQSPFTVSILKSRVSIVAISATSNGLLLLRRMATTGRRSDPCVRSAGLLRIQFNPAGIFLRGGETIVDREATVGRPRSANHAFNSSSRSPPPRMLSICLSDYPPSSLPNCFTLPYTPDLGYCRPSAATQLPDDAHDAYQQKSVVPVGEPITPLPLTMRPACYSSSSIMCNLEALHANSLDEDEFMLEEESVVSLLKLTRTREETRVQLCTP